MTTTATGTLGEIEIFRNNARTTHTVVRLNVEGLIHEDTLIQPTPGGNCLNWVVGHLVCIYDEVLPMLGQKPVMERGALKRYARGTPPLCDPAEALQLRELVSAWEEASKRFDAGLSGLTSKALDAPAPASPTKNPDETLRSLLALVSFHQAYHAGQTGLLRRIAGKEGAIP
ncbi:MAG: DinB family protein [Terriglobia bacterium]